MTKRELVKLLEDKKAESINTVKNQYEEAVESYKNEVWKSCELNKLAEDISSRMQESFVLFEDFKSKLLKDYEVRLQNLYFGSLGDVLSKFSDPKLVCKNITTSALYSSNSKIKSLGDKKSALISEITKNYDNLIMNVKSMKNAKVAIEYLVNEVGFNKSEFAVVDECHCTALACQVDSRYLFIGGINTKTKEESSGESK